MSHLWEADHRYYCNEGNYYAPGNNQPTQYYKSWSDFISEEGDSDMDMNLVFRWDWSEEEYKGDDNYRNGKLLIFIMGQRKGLYRWVEIEVCRADEPAVIEYLRQRWQHMRELWEPLSV